jgi:uncharacterized membrane protein YkvA (DUF1232 family)
MQIEKMVQETVEPQGFWDKLYRNALAMGRDLVRSALALWYCLMDARTSMADRGVIAAALVYLISPFDAMPEAFMGPAGYIDDASVIAAALAVLGSAVTEEHLEAAQRKLRAWFS